MTKRCPECRTRPCAEGRELCWECLSDLYAAGSGRCDASGKQLDAISLLEDLIDDDDDRGGP